MIKPRSRFADWVAPGLVLGAILFGVLPLAMLIGWQGNGLKLDASIGRVLLFTLQQAALSTVLSVVPALALAHALSRRQFPGRTIVLNILAIPLAMPAIVAVVALIGIFGQRGPLGGWFQLYGLFGIVLAHVFFNLPMATRLVLESYGAIPPENFRLAAQLGFGDFAVYRWVVWPVVRRSLAAIASLVFLLCAASFVVVLTLGGGPQASTLEVAIYQSLRMDFDLQRAAVLALIQLGLCLVLVVGLQRLSLGQLGATPTFITAQRFDGRHWLARLMDAGLIVLALMLVVPPLVALLASGLSSLYINQSLLVALGWSLGIGSAAGLVSVALGWRLAQSGLHNPLLHKLAGVIALAGLIVPPAILATGWFVALHSYSNSMLVTGGLIIALNSLMALPFTMAILQPRLQLLAQQQDLLCASLGLAGWQRFRTIDFPAMRRPLAQAFFMGLVIALGDLTAITLFGNQGIITLPALIHQQMGNYRGAMAEGTAIMLAALCFALSAFAQRPGHAHDQN